MSVFASVAEVTYATLRTICGENTLQDLLEKRQEISDTIENYVYEKVNRWGKKYSNFRYLCGANLHKGHAN